MLKSPRRGRGWWRVPGPSREDPGREGQEAARVLRLLSAGRT